MSLETLPPSGGNHPCSPSGDKQAGTFTRGIRFGEQGYIVSSDSRVQAAVGGDVAAMTALLQECAPEVERSLSIGREWQSVLEPADVMQVTYIEAFLRIGQFDASRADAFAPWLRRIAENNLRDAIRGLQAQKRPQPAARVALTAGADSQDVLLAELGVTTTTPSRHATREERSSRLKAALDALPDDYGQVVRLYDLECLPIAEVAERMGRSAGAVHMLRARAHDRLRPLLGTESAWFGSSA